MTLDWQTYPCLFNISSGEEIRKWPTTGGISALSASGDRFLSNTESTNSEGAIVESCSVYDIERVEPIFSIKTKYPFCRSISPDGELVLIGIDKATSELWNVNEQRLIGTIPITSTKSLPFHFARFSMAKKLLAVPTSKGIAIWDVTQCSKVAEWNPPNFDHISSLEWSPDGSRLVASYIEMLPAPNPATATGPTVRNATQNAIDHCFLLDLMVASSVNLWHKCNVHSIGRSHRNGLWWCNYLRWSNRRSTSLDTRSPHGACSYEPSNPILTRRKLDVDQWRSDPLPQDANRILVWLLPDSCILGNGYVSYIDDCAIA